MLQVRRTSSGIFAGKYGLITLRDLFRWAERYCRSPTASNEFRDWEQQLAEDGQWLMQQLRCHIVKVQLTCDYPALI